MKKSFIRYVIYSSVKCIWFELAFCIYAIKILLIGDNIPHDIGAAVVAVIMVGITVVEVEINSRKAGNVLESDAG